MKVFRVNIVVCTLASLLIYMWSSVCMAYPLPTVDWKRLGDSAKQASQIAKQVQIEVQSNLNIIRQIQNGGYAAAAGELFGKIERGDYDRYGKMYADSKQVLEDGADATKKKKEEEAKVKEKNQETAAKTAEETAKDNAEAQKQADAAQKANNEKAKKSKWSQAYSWVKKYGRSTSDAAFGVADAIKSGGSITTVGKNLYDSAGKSGMKVYQGMKDDHDQQKAEEEKRAEAQKQAEEKKKAEEEKKAEEKAKSDGAKTDTEEK